jgi:hypothetical protein
MLFDPLEKKFYLPTTFVKMRNGQRRSQSISTPGIENSIHFGIPLIYDNPYKRIPVIWNSADH